MKWMRFRFTSIKDEEVFRNQHERQAMRVSTGRTVALYTPVRLENNVKTYFLCFEPKLENDVAQICISHGGVFCDAPPDKELEVVCEAGVFDPF